MIDATRWRKWTFYQQMGNIASELSRAIRFNENQDGPHLDASLRRLLELVELTIEDPQNRGRLRELCRFKEVVGDWYCGTNVYSVRPESLLNYAMDFALLARKAI
jgi:hypothetical protein